MNKIKIWGLQQILPYLIELLVKFLSSEEFKDLLDSILDIMEEKIAESETTVDDHLLKVIDAIRAIFDIPDNDLPEPVIYGD